MTSAGASRAQGTSPCAPRVRVEPGSHDRREGGRWTFSQSVKNHALFAGVRAALWVVWPLPERWIVVLAVALGRAAFALGGGHRRTALANLARAYPGSSDAERRAIAAHAYRELASYLGEAVARLGRPRRFVPLSLDGDSQRVLADAVAGGAGVLFVSAHLGPWERVAGSLVHHGFPLVTLAREAYDPRFVALYDELRGGLGVRCIYRGSPGAPVALVRTLRRGGVLGVPMDLASRVPSVRVPFLDVPARTPVGPARIALRTGAAVVVGTVAPVDAREGGQRTTELVMRVSLVRTTDLRPGSEGERELTRRLNDVLSSRIRAFPQGWVWMHPRWGGEDRHFSTHFRGETL